MAACGPLSGIRIIEFAGMGPAPFCGMLLSDLGADVLRIDRPGTPGAYATEVLARGRRSLAADLKDPRATELCLALIERADVLVEGFRPGVMERLGLGPDTALARNERLIYGRMTGWGQTGALARTAGHDIDYIAISGALGHIGPAGAAPVPPLNLLADFGGGGLYLALGIVASLLEREKSLRGQVIDAAMVDGVASLFGMHAGLLEGGVVGGRGKHMLDGSAHYYRCYECADGKYLAVGAVEPHFYKLLLQLIDEQDPAFESQQEKDWERIGQHLQRIFLSKRRDEWAELFAGTDACVVPVLDFHEAARHPHNAERGLYQEKYGFLQPAPAPRFSRTPGAIQGPPTPIGAGGLSAAVEWGVPRELIDAAAPG